MTGQLLQLRREGRWADTVLTAFYDGNCLICQSTCASLRALDWLNRIDFVDLHDEAAWRSDALKFNHEGLMGEIHVFDEEDRLYKGFAGTRRLLKELPLGFPLWLLLHAPGMERLGQRVYRAMALRRYRINALLGNDLPDCGGGKCKMPQ